MNQKIDLVSFLKGLSQGKADADQWQEYMVTHYFDEELEAIRVECVRLFLDYEGELEHVCKDQLRVDHIDKLISRLERSN